MEKVRLCFLFFLLVDMEPIPYMVDSFQNITVIVRTISVIVDFTKTLEKIDFPSVDDINRWIKTLYKM